MPVDGISSLPFNWHEGAQLWRILRGFFHFFPTEEAPASHAPGPLRALAAPQAWRCHPSAAGRDPFPAGVVGFPAHIHPLREARMWAGSGKASWESHVWSHTGSHPGLIRAGAARRAPSTSSCSIWCSTPTTQKSHAHKFTPVFCGCLMI